MNEIDARMTEKEALRRIVAGRAGMDLRAEKTRQAIRRELTARQRQMVEMYYGECMVMAEIAAALGVNVSTVSRTLARSREKLRQCLRYGVLRAGED